jgi:hypothetical protein
LRKSKKSFINFWQFYDDWYLLGCGVNVLMVLAATAGSRLLIIGGATFHSHSREFAPAIQRRRVVSPECIVP